jgi:histidine kinase
MQVGSPSSHVLVNFIFIHFILTLPAIAASEALCVIGDYPTLTALSKMPLHHARCFDDKLNTYSNLVRALSSSGNIDECIDTCVSVLSQLGESLPTKVTPEVYFDEVAKVRQSLMGLSRQDLWSLPLMTDLNKLTAMQFLNHMLIVTYTAKPPLNPIVVFRMMKMSVDFGVCNISAIAFSCYGAWLASSLNDDYDAAFAMGRFASELMKKLSGAESVPRIYAVVYGMINFYKE